METKSDPRYEKLKALVDKYNEYLDFWGDLCLGFECEVRRFNGGEWIISEIDSPSVIYSVEDFKRIVNVDFPNAIRKHLDKITITNKSNRITRKIKEFLTDDEYSHYRTYMSK